MTKKKLEQYISLVKELGQLTEEISMLSTRDEYKVTDWAKDGDGHIITLRGYDETLIDAMLHTRDELVNRQRECAEEIASIELFIYGIKDYQIRNILTLRYIKGLCLKDTAKAIGYCERVIIERIRKFFKNIA